MHVSGTVQDFLQRSFVFDSVDELAVVQLDAI